MKRWFTAGLLSAGVLIGVAWHLIGSSNKPASSGMTVRWVEAAWSEKRQGRRAAPADSEAFEYRKVRIRNESPRELASVRLFPSVNPDDAAVEQAARDLAKAGHNFTPGGGTEIQYRRRKGEPMTLYVIAFDFNTSELATRLEQRNRFPWARILLPLRHKVIKLPEE